MRLNLPQSAKPDLLLHLDIWFQFGNVTLTLQLRNGGRLLNINQVSGRWWTRVQVVGWKQDVCCSALQVVECAPLLEVFAGCHVYHRVVDGRLSFLALSRSWFLLVILVVKTLIKCRFFLVDVGWHLFVQGILKVDAKCIFGFTWDCIRADSADIFCDLVLKNNLALNRSEVSGTFLLLLIFLSFVKVFSVQLFIELHVALAHTCDYWHLLG